MSRSKFWDQGIQFECQGTGNCCMSRNSYGYVYLTLKDRQRFARFFKLTTAMFTKKYCVKTEGHFHLRAPEKNCEFLKDKQCTVYEARPTQCRTWPFWPENMNAKTWNEEVAPFCAGVGRGKLYAPSEIEDLLKLEATES